MTKMWHFSGPSNSMDSKGERMYQETLSTTYVYMSLI